MNREQITAMLDGLDGVTPGPWYQSYIEVDTSPITLAFRHEVGSPDRGIACRIGKPTDAAHIARCDPDTIRALCEMALRALRYESVNPSDFRYWEGRYRDEAAENERLRAALKDAAESMTCKPGEFDAAHFCPNCDSNLYGPRDSARRALERKPE